MNITKITALLTYLSDWNNDYVDSLEIINENRISVDGWEYLIVNMDERWNEFKGFQKMLWEEMGLEGFESWFAQDIINRFLNNEKVYYLSCQGLEVPEEYKHEFNSYVDYVYHVFGVTEATDIINRFDLLNFDMLCEQIAKNDGYGQTLASYDGQQLELENGYFAYLLG